MPQTGIQVLYIDDDAGLGRLVQKEFGRHGVNVEHATDGVEAVARLARGKYDAVALDHHMPGQDGLTTLAAINRIPNPPPAVYVTASQEGGIAIAALKAGAAHYVIKDVQGEFLVLLRAAIEAAIEAARIRSAKEAAEAKLRAARDRFEALAKERGVLLQEVDHRVGNSLQLIASLLRMRARHATDAETKALLAGIEGRVLAVANVHRRLYTSEDVRSVALDQYLKELVVNLGATAESDSARGSLRLTADPVAVDPDRAVAIGMIVTELVVNALKYAYPGDGGPIRVALQARDGESAVLSVEDDGVGYLRYDARSGGLGSKIVQAMADRIQGSLSYDPEHRGTRATLTFALVQPLDGV